MIYQSTHQSPTMSSSRKTSPRPQHRKFQSMAAKSSVSSNSRSKRDCDRPAERCRGRCRVQWSEKHVKEGLVLVQESQLARVVKTGPIAEHYEIDPKPFASGQWAKVYRCRSRSTGTLYAAKYSSRNRFNADCSAELRHEIALLSLCSQSPRVVRLHDVYETPKEIILVMEYAPGGDLQTLIDGDLVPLEGDVVHFVKQLVDGLAYLHERNIAHLDIKPQNLVMMGSFPECDVKLCDFEISRVVLEGTEVREILGTPDYVAPEILHYEPITLAADMWSLGVTTYVLLTGFSPFGGETDQETFQNISLGEVDFPEELFEDISAQAKDFVASLLVLDPSARMSAKQCLRHEWLRGAPTQASPHLRKYLSKSREVLLERVVSRENLRRAALLSQATSHANLAEATVDPGFSSHLSQSEMCLNLSLTGSRGSLTSSECYMSPADSQTSLASSQNSLATSQASLAASQCYLLNKEQTQGLLNQAQSRSQANLNHVTRRGLLSRMRSLNQIQSQACLVSGKTASQKEQMNPLFGSRSQEKLYGLKCLSKSQGVLDICRSLECLRKSRKMKKKNQRSVTEDFPIFSKLGSDPLPTSTGATDPSEDPAKIPEIPKSEHDRPDDKENEVKHTKLPTEKTQKQTMLNESNEKIVQVSLKDSTPEAEENLDSLQSVESDTLTEDSDETSLDKNRLSVRQPSHRQHSNISSHSNNSVNSDEKDEHSDFENDEPKYSVAQLVSAFNKHQEVASKTSLEAIMIEKRVNEVTFPTGPKALRLFIPDINITERGIVRRKTSYKPRKNWEELRKQNEKNEGLIKDFDNDSGNEDDEESENNERIENKGQEDLSATEIKIEEIHWSSEGFPGRGDETLDNRDTTIDEKYKHCVDIAKSGQITKELENKETADKVQKSMSTRIPRSSYQKERLPNYIYPEMMSTREEPSKFTKAQKDQDSSVNLKDILQRSDASQNAQKENLEKLRKRTSITKIIVNDNLPGDNDTNNNGVNRAKSEPPVVVVTQYKGEDKVGGNPSLTRSSSSSSERSSPTPSSGQSDLSGISWDKEDCKGQRKVLTSCEGSRQQSDKLETKKVPLTPEERRIRGKVCTGSYTRAMEKFSSKNSERKSGNLLTQQTDKTRRKSSPNMPQNGS
ncbi:striated muscle preferentially expressed protein kinase-like [Diachasmimorpha longicaudata]|uniref:striated muscle preferentially expressed protein kinase-like n=1 Tax=Diachasmimorpha longicaudata TaxID=58733 RepID=UPI0030B8C24F